MNPQHLGAYMKDFIGLLPQSITAGGGNDGAVINGPSIDRQEFYSGVAGVPITATLAEGETAEVEVKLQHSADESNWEDYSDDPATLTLTGGTGGTTETGIAELDENLRGAYRYVRAVVTVTLSAASTDTADFASVVSLGGSVKKPV